MPVPSMRSFPAVPVNCVGQTPAFGGGAPWEANDAGGGVPAALGVIGAAVPAAGGGG